MSKVIAIESGWMTRWKYGIATAFVSISTRTRGRRTESPDFITRRASPDLRASYRVLKNRGNALQPSLSSFIRDSIWNAFFAAGALELANNFAFISSCAVVFMHVSLDWPPARFSDVFGEVWQPGLGDGTWELGRSPVGAMRGWKRGESNRLMKDRKSVV